MLQGFRNRFHFPFFVWIILMWTLLMGEISWANTFGGAAVALIVMLALPLPATPTKGIRISWGRLLLFGLIWLRDLAVASVKVGWLAIRPQEPPKTAILTVPMRVSNDLVLAFATAAYNLQPGGSVSDIDIANRLWTIHVLDADDESDIKREIDNVLTLERRMIDIFEGGK
ncbi:Na+/H+ antiporter subunit E [Corynebacterium guangdongense]|uniref:Multicomponent Na+:H+ antiporter subunit E n=1 Tax=Corynebacterium guangdongense TaxID=1783348 RepID=A0ABU1ZZI9_9CORY|nr:Na+/H+ antiporter subunit E [Corynebacterium guangdongense]MDR7330329.1 multicomponent Na+:H+ antiporter subunit E [Corynebacterium guangdongense]WJZ18887.1 putative monovalent cation/H+ antiporter subunit E [Corynebacterium guangdongense]